MKTPEEARAAWVEALRSGEYKQGRAYLHIGDRYCCLGVACKLAIDEGLPVIVNETAPDEGIMMYDSEVAWLPASVQQWLGLKTDAGDYTARNGRKSSLTRRNDDGASFEKVADIIESKPKGLFADGAPEDEG